MDSVRRGNIVAVALQGDLGKPRPALIVQTDLVLDHPSSVVLPMTTTLISAPLIRITVEATPETGLRDTSQIMVDKPMTVSSPRFGGVIGRVDDDLMVRVSRALAVWLGLA
jgi:mRNA interferase MazF